MARGMAESVYECFVFPDPYDRQAINNTIQAEKEKRTLYTDDSTESAAPKQKKPESAATVVVNCDDPCGPFVEDTLEVHVQDDCEQLEQEHSLCHFGSEDSDIMVEDKVNLLDEESDTECEGVKCAHKSFRVNSIQVRILPLQQVTLQ